MQIILTQLEIAHAVRESVLPQIAIREDQSINVAIVPSGNEIIASITITRAEEAEATKPKAKPVKKVEATPIVQTTIAPPPRREPEAKAESSDAPREEEPANEETPVVAAPKLFPDAATSAPAPAAEGAKSLFANLVKPVHDAPRD
jgi:hypothetical protein